ncbi:MAG: hypothetical protein HOW73_44160 [Polyangiaceae bacterium]|nr:hypothetical protein [Polyangiaceae bacterium]
MLRAPTILAAAALLSLVACSPTIGPRTADTAPEGEFAFSGSATALHLGWGNVRAEHAPAPTREFTGGGDMYPDDQTFAWGFSASTLYEIELRYGLTRWAEMGAFAGFSRIGLEGRFALMDEDIGHPLSIAASYGAAYSAIGDGAWMRGGLDFSVRATDDVAPFFDVYVSREATTHSAHQGDTPCPEEGYPGTVCGVFIAERQNEVRLTLALGLAFRVDRTVLRGSLAPYIPLHAVSLTCPECTGEARPIAGGHAIIGFDYPAWESKGQ